MWYYMMKLMVSAGAVVVVSEIAKRHSGFAALVAALPLTSLLAFVWMQLEGAPPQAVAELSIQIFWLVLPSLVLFLVLPALLKHGVGFWLSLLGAAAATVVCYFAMLPLLRKVSVQ
jgi:hypothetical protein